MSTARDLTARLADLLRREHAAMADFLVVAAEVRPAEALPPPGGRDSAPARPTAGRHAPHRTVAAAALLRANHHFGSAG